MHPANPFRQIEGRRSGILSPAVQLAAVMLFFCAGSGLAAAIDLVIADFEGTNYGDWNVEGEAFGSGPARGTLPGQMKVDGFLGRGLVNSFHHGDGATGTLTSPPFKIERRFIQFLVGGGQHPGETCVNLLVAGKVVRTTTGPNATPGGSEHLDWQEWDVEELDGQTAVIQIVDAATGGWGHINCDQIIQTDRRRPVLITDATRELRLTRRYLNLPIKNGAPKRRMSFSVENGPVREFEIELADTAADWWAFLDVAAFKGCRAVLRVDKLPEDSTGLQAVEQADRIKDSANLYQEKLRPQFHFSSRRGWNNDPNGLVYYRGEYHLFYQHNPYGWNWGNMHWGHAVSRDLVHWQELPIALYPDEHGTMFSGSAVVDWDNTAGFQTTREKPLVCIFTAAGQPFTQGLAYSNDRGRTWSKYPNNPVLQHIAGDNRDPKVIRYVPENKWVMALYLEKNDYALFESSDLKDWRKICDVPFPGTTECPEFFEIAVDDNPRNTRWIFYGGNGRYLVGRFDGKTFTPEAGPHPLNFGNCFYASQTYNALPAPDGRRILIPWGQISLPGMPFNQMMGLPVALTLRTTGGELRLAAYPVQELASLRTKTRHWRPQTLPPGVNPLAEVKGELFDLEAELAPGAADSLAFNLRGQIVTYDADRQILKCLNKSAPLKPKDGKIRLRILVDRASIDIFGNDGELYMPMGKILDPDDQSLGLSAAGGAARIVSLKVHHLKSAWR